MKILKMKVNWNEGIANGPDLQILVDKIPERDEMVYENKGPLYYAEKDGCVSFFQRSMSEPGRGFGGRSFELNMKDGDVVTLVGPWSSRSAVMNEARFTPCMDVDITDDPEKYERGQFRAGHATIETLFDFVRERPEEVPKIYLVEVHDGKEFTWIPSIDPDIVTKLKIRKAIPRDGSEKLSEVQKDVVKATPETKQIGMMEYALSDDKKTVTITLPKDSNATLAVAGKECRSNDIIIVDAYPKE